MSHDPPSAGPSQPADQPTARPNSYVVVARRYRPKTFDELVGQQQMTRALINAINTNRVGHAYLFTGARGVGKTSTARIFAKALNAPNGPTPNPDNDSDICQAIDAGEDVDVIEIDGASNRGIDEIRQLRSNANVRPSRARYKIYIIDEVHMLTTAAFNALLKTLEEPPPHVKFIFCTTDPQKIPITVLSRCQRYDFAPVDAPSIVQRLRHIVSSEGRDAELEALQILARRAEGSMRDSQSLLEQLLAYCSGTIRVEDVHRMLGTAASGRLVALTRCLLTRDAAGALAVIDEGVTQGVDCGQLTEQLLGYLRDIMTVLVGGSPGLLRHTSEADYPALQEAGKQLGLQTTLAAFEILDQAVVRMRQSTQPRTLLEIAVVRICHLEDLDQLAGLIEQLRGGELRPSPASRGPSSQSPAGSGPAPGPPPEKKNIHAGSRPPEAPSTPPSALALTAESADHIWKQVLDELGDMTADFASYYDHVAISAPNSLVVHFRKGYTLQKESCELPDRKAQLEQTMARIVGHPVRIEIAVIPEADQPSIVPAPSMFQLMREKETHPLVRQAVELFDAEVIRVELPRPSTGETPAAGARTSTTEGAD
jgi:DNA polymerase-3 subunit gamma/tau